MPATAKSEVQTILQNLPDDCTLEDIQYHLYVLEKVKNGLNDIEEGRILTDEQAKERLKKWL